MSKPVKLTTWNSKAQAKVGVLLINLGTPRSPHPRDVKKYLKEFLTDKHVIDMPYLRRQLLVRRIIVPRRYRTSAHSYREIWTEKGSPLLVHSEHLKEALQKELKDNFCVKLAMRYQLPSIRGAIEAFKKINLSSLIIIPLFPHFSRATTGSVQNEVLTVLRSYPRLPELKFIQSYGTHTAFIDALCAQVKGIDLDAYDRILFSYHGLPQSQLTKADPFSHCLQSDHCCKALTEKNCHCYAAQCSATTRALVKALDLSPDQYIHCYQSRLGKGEWLRPYTSDAIREAAQKGKKKLLVFCPSFAADCLETLFEIKREYFEMFLQCGGEKLDLVRGLNSHPLWVKALKKLIESSPTAHRF